MIDLKSLSLSELKEFFKRISEPEFRAKQVYDWIHKKLIDDFDNMSNLSLALREKLKEQTKITSLKMIVERISKIDGTRKYLFELEDGHMIESVLMRYKHGNSVCISSQVGCRMGCKFCASTIDGLMRNLSAGEMLDQIYKIQKHIGERVSNIVVMGSGEPMDNYDNLIDFIHLISCDDGLHISQRNITVSTCGIVPNMLRLAEEKLQITLALSLHAPEDAIRKELMPIANKYSIKEILAACNNYYQKTGRRVTYEYSLVAGVNDNLEEAKKLIKIIKDMRGHVNLIPVNPIEERNFKESGSKAIANFKKELKKNGINVTIRREMGRDIDGACGQLRRHYKNDERGDV